MIQCVRLRVLLVVTMALTLLQTGCSAPIPREDVPVGWALDVHQPGEWWTQPLIPRSVVVERCPPKFGWASDPDLTRLTALPPGSSIEYSFWTDDYHCSIGWSEPTTTIEGAVGDLTSEQVLRRICSSSGLPMDDAWRYLGSSPAQRAGGSADPEDVYAEWEATTAGFIDSYGTVVGCSIESWSDSGAYAQLGLSVGSDLAVGGTAACPVVPRDLGASADGTLAEYRFRGAGAVRDENGDVLTRAETLRIGLSGDSVTTSHPVVDGIAIVDALVVPEAAIPVDWDVPPEVEGEVFDARGRVLATCRT